jgi:hypothetical protein
MKLYGYTRATALPTSPDVGQIVFLSVDGLTGTLQHWDGSAWVLVGGTPQLLSIVGDQLTLSGGGGSVTLPTFSWREVVNSTIVAPMDVANGIAVSNSSATTVTIPLNSAVPIAVGSSVLVAADDVGTVTLVPASGVTLHVGNGLSTTLLGQYSVVTLIKRSPDVWYAAGDFATP